ncbi:hypothetical protein F4814DRAFT_412926 [Daldinia grandis]|nr:hypothetical protein F4814DRAFT_412926 [Daldinia grandis]
MPSNTKMTPTRTDEEIQAWTPRDIEIVDTIFRSCPAQSKPKISDWSTLAQKLGLKNEQSAKETIRVLYRKRKWFNANESRSEFKSNLDLGSKPSSSAQKEAAIQDERASEIKKYNTRGRARKQPRAKLSPIPTELIETSESEERI